MNAKPESCRVCLKDNTETDPLLQVCNCSREELLVHKSCAEEWLEFTSQTRCPYCGFKVIVEYQSKTFFEYLKETPEDVEEIKEVLLRTVNVCHMLALSLVIWNFNPFSCFSTKTIYSIITFRAFFVLRLWYLFSRRTVYSLKEWQKNHFRVRVFPNPNPNLTSTSNKKLQ